MFLLVFSLAACQQSGEQGGNEEEEQGETNQGGNQQDGGSGSGSGEAEKITVTLNQRALELEVGASETIKVTNVAAGITYAQAVTGDGEVEVTPADAQGEWLVKGKTAGTVNFKVTATKGTLTADATCVITVKAPAQPAAPEVPATGYAVTIGSQVITLEADPAAQNEGAFANRQQGYKNLVSNVHAGEKIQFFKDGEAYAYVDAAGDNLAAQPPVYNNFVHGAQGGFEIQADNAAENNFYVNLWKANDAGEAWFTFFLEGGSSAEHGTKAGSQGGESGGQGQQTGQTGYGLKIGDTPVLGEKLAEKDHQQRDQYKITAQAFTAGQTFTLYDASNGATWVIDIDPYSFSPVGGQSTSDAERVATYVTKGESAYTVVQDFTADIYIKLKMNDDQIYFQLVA